MLRSHGWSQRLHEDFAHHALAGLQPGRVLAQHRDRYRIATEAGELEAQISGRLAREAPPGGFPVAGDWVAAQLRPEERAATIQAVLPRASAFVRRAAGPAGGAQLVAANAETALLVASLNGDLNPRRLERYLAFAYESGSRPVIVLTKADASDRTPEQLAEVAQVAGTAPVVTVSARTGEGLAALAAHMPAGETAVLLGSSGAGKSTLVNALAGTERMATGAIREDDARGRHTTSHRELILLPSGALILDTPGMRELGLWDADAGLATAFTDVEALADACRFRDCGHGNEPGCAVQAALADGRLSADRWAAFGKLQAELAHEQRKEDPRIQAAARRMVVQRTKGLRAVLKRKRRTSED